MILIYSCAFCSSEQKETKKGPRTWLVDLEANALMADGGNVDGGQADLLLPPTTEPVKPGALTGGGIAEKQKGQRRFRWLPLAGN